MEYIVEVTREGNAWLASVENLPGAHTYARNLAALHREVDDVIRLMADLPDDAQVVKRMTFKNVTPKQQQAAELREVREGLATRERQLLVATVLTAKQLADEGNSFRDIAGLLGLTNGRISQLAEKVVEPDADEVRAALIADWKAGVAAGG